LAPDRNREFCLCWISKNEVRQQRKLYGNRPDNNEANDWPQAKEGMLEIEEQAEIPATNVSRQDDTEINNRELTGEASKG